MNYKKPAIAVAALLLFYLLGWYPASREASALAKELAEERGTSAAQAYRLRVAGVRDAGTLLYIEVLRQNYAPAATLATRFFDGLQAAAAESGDPQEKALFERILSQRDGITANLTLAAPALPSQLQALLLELHGHVSP